MSKPYFESKSGKLYHGDCLEILTNLNEDISCMITDPPYNISYEDNNSNKITKKGNGFISNAEMFGHFEPKNSEEWETFIRKFVKLSYQKIKGSIIIFYDKYEITWLKNICKSIGYYPANILSIIKRNPLPHLMKTNFRSDIELSLFLQKKKNKDIFNFLNQKEMVCTDFYNIGQKDTLHPTEKPLKVIEKYVRVISNENDTILDPFCGGGTTLVAAEKQNRNWIGIDINKDYLDMTIERLSKYGRIDNKFKELF